VPDPTKTKSEADPANEVEAEALTLDVPKCQLESFAEGMRIPRERTGEQMRTEW
jgi:hypothetical protein